MDGTIVSSLRQNENSLSTLGVHLMVIHLRPPCTLSREKNGALCFSDGRSPWDLALFSFGKPWDFILPTLYYCNLDRYYHFRTIHVLTDTISVAVCDVSGLYICMGYWVM